MFKITNKDTRDMVMTLLWCLYCQLSTYFVTFSNVYNVDCERALVC